MEVDLRKVKRIARITRRWAEEYAEHKGGNPTLACLCAIASAELHKRLRAQKQPSVLYENSEHCFVMCSDYVVDVTATQFKFSLGVNEPVFIRKYDEVSHHSFYKKRARFASVKALRAYQAKAGWPRDQIALE